jgi:hypothetical protein
LPALGIGIAFFGYWVMYYGLTQVQSGNWGFLDLGIPSRWTAQVAATPKDSGGPTAGGNNTLPAGATGATTNPGAAAGGQAVIAPNPGGPSQYNPGGGGFSSTPGDITPGNTGRFITGTPSSVPPAV